MNLFLMKYFIKRAMKEKTLIFWNIAFPLLLATIFGIALKNIDKSSEIIYRIPIMVESPVYREILSQMKYKEKNMYDIKEYKNPENALKSGEIKAFIKGGIISDSTEIIQKFKEEGINISLSNKDKKRYIYEKVDLKEFEKEKIFLSITNRKVFENIKDYKKNSIFINELNLGNVNINILSRGKEVDILEETINSINQTSMAVYYIAESEYGLNQANHNAESSKIEKNRKVNEISFGKAFKNVFGEERKNPNTIFFYSLLAMICLGNITFGVTIVEDMNLDSEFKHVIRSSISPISREIMLISETLVYLCFNTIVSMILYSYIRFVLKVAFGRNSMYVFLTILVSNIMALSMGMFLSFVIKSKTSTKYSLAASFYVFSCFISGMMSVNMLGTFANKMTFVNIINPATVITRMLLSLYITDSSQMYWRLFINLCMITLVFIVATICAYRKRVKK